VAEAAHVPLKEQGIRILNYLDEKLILAQDLVLAHLSQLGLRVNWEKSKLSPMQRISFLCMELDLVEQTTRLTQECAQSVLNCLNTFKCRTAVPLKLFQRLLGHMAAHGSYTAGAAPYETASTLAPRPSPEEGVATRHSPGQSDTGLPPKFHPMAGVPLEQVFRHAVVHTDASTTGWGATYDGQAVSGVWMGPQLHWHINCLELLAVVLTRQAHAGPHGQHCDRCVHQLTRWSTLPSHVATCPPPPPLESEASELTSCHSHSGLAQPCTPRRMETPSPVGPADMETFWVGSGRPVHLSRNVPLPVVLFPDRGNAQHGRTGTQQATGPAQTLCKIREDEEQFLLVAPYWPTRTWFPELILLVTPPWQIPLRKDLLTQRGGTLWHPCPDLWKLHVWSLDGMRKVVDTIASARAQSMRHAYALKWNLFIETPEDARSESLSPSTLKVYVAAISAHHDPIEGKSVEKHDLVISFLRGARRLNPPRLPSVPSWDLSLVLTALWQAPFEHLRSVELKFLSMKTLLLLALASIKRVGDLHAFSVDESCLEFGLVDSKVTLRPRPGYVPK
ncbi:hypothetical protein M9458_006083, partial [Cirrhinus mrigala]